MSQVPDSNCKGLLVIFMTTKEVLTNIGALLANKSARSQIRKKEVLTSLDPSIPYWLESCPNKCLATSNNICAFSRWMIMRFEPQVPNTMSLKVVREEADRGEPYRSERANHLCMKKFFLLPKWDFARPSSPEFSLGKARSWAEEERKYGDMSL